MSEPSIEALAALDDIKRLFGRLETLFAEYHATIERTRFAIDASNALLNPIAPLLPHARRRERTRGLGALPIRSDSAGAAS